MIGIIQITVSGTRTLDGWKAGWKPGWRAGWMDGWIDGRTDGQIPNSPRVLQDFVPFGTAAQKGRKKAVHE